ncbi:MAG: helix-turn-helix transcriptional regulator [Rubrivivax sp.]|nr:helix-turn-helix transcriptional regulator [Rubrivivax sp.]
MSDFASAAMVRVLAQGMRERGLQPPDEAAQVGTEAAAMATVTLALKRRVVHSAVRQGGFECLALLGRGLHHFRNDPTHLALASARDAAELFARWARLERYVHSRHRCVLSSMELQEARLRHVAPGGGEPPRAAEDLVVLGLLAALLEAIGLHEVRAWAGGVPVLPQPDPQALVRAAGRRGGTAHWRLAWSGTAQPRSGITPAALQPGLDQLLAPVGWPVPLHDCARVLLSELTQPPPLPALAQRLGWAPRSLQRALLRAGLGYAALLAELRCRTGAWWLLHTRAPIAELGFVCGYADQSHFTRELRRRVGMTPARYREAFAVPGGGG